MAKKSPARPRGSDLEDFLALSRILTGVDNLDPGIGLQYLDRLSGTPFGPNLRQILDRFRKLGKRPTAKQVKKQIVGVVALRPALCQIVLLWYTSAIQDNPDDPKVATNMRYGTQEEYFSGLGWRLIGAHAPGLSGGYFGHWRYRPENEPLEDS
jgi:hypothetical protein